MKEVFQEGRCADRLRKIRTETGEEVITARGGMGVVGRKKKP